MVTVWRLSLNVEMPFGQRELLSELGQRFCGRGAWHTMVGDESKVPTPREVPKG